MTLAADIILAGDLCQGCRPGGHLNRRAFLSY
jgi:hypothetical protein